MTTVETTYLSGAGEMFVLEKVCMTFMSGQDQS